ncbi:MAG: GNAT family N-acetyltransferase [Saprospiraceae bacterium]|nr:GNAT family N-acetyltransferase [Saprospiraceae bacterium]
MDIKNGIELKRVNTSSKDFIDLVAILDQELAIRDGAEHDFYDQFNSLEDIKYAVVAYVEDQAVGCGAIKAYTDTSMEVKRMFTKKESRGKGIAGLILIELEGWAKSLGYDRCILETGLKQPEAIGLYSKSGYKIIENYGQYKGIENSVCFMKMLS